MKYKLRKSTATVIVLLVAGMGAVTLQAAPTCQRIVKRYVEHLVPVHYRKSTIARWAAWNKLHPNYHPPKRKPRLTPKEILDKVAFDCIVDTPSTIPGPMLVQLDVPPPPVEMATIATLDAPIPPVLPLPGVTLTPSPVLDGDVPEPAAWILLLTGFAAIAALRRRFHAGEPISQV